MFRVTVTVLTAMCLSRSATVFLQPLAISFTTSSRGEEVYNAAQRVKRQAPDCNTQSGELEERFCELPPPLEHGRFSPSQKRCPSTTSSVACQMIPGTLVPPNWVIFHSCIPGYKKHNGKTLSVCAKGRWVPPLPVCVVDGCYLPVKPMQGWYRAANYCRSHEVGVDVCRNKPGTLVPSSWTIRYTCNSYHLNTTSALSRCENATWTNPVDCLNIPQDLEQGGNPESQERLSVLKCREYAKYVFTQRKAANGDGVTETDTCSLVEPLRRKRVVGGTPAIPREFPHMALIGYGEDTTLEWLCGGSLISERFVLSLALCADGGIKDRVRRGLARWIKLGDYDQTSSVDDDKRQSESRVYEISERIVHPGYKRLGKYNDIALYKLKETVKFNEFVRPICLYTEPTIAMAYAIATGWGVTEQGGELSKILQKANLTIIGKTQCENEYKNISIRILSRGIDDATQLCTRDLENRRDTCMGDSGGPLQIRLADPYCMYSQVGITAFGVGCAAGYPGVYTRVSHYVPWIERIVWPQS